MNFNDCVDEKRRLKAAAVIRQWVQAAGLFKQGGEVNSTDYTLSLPRASLICVPGDNPGSGCHQDEQKDSLWHSCSFYNFKVSDGALLRRVAHLHPAGRALTCFCSRLGCLRQMRVGPFPSRAFNYFALDPASF